MPSQISEANRKKGGYYVTGRPTELARIVKDYYMDSLVWPRIVKNHYMDFWIQNPLCSARLAVHVCKV